MNENNDEPLPRRQRFQLVIESPEVSINSEIEALDLSLNHLNLEDNLIDNMAHQPTVEQLISAARNYGEIIPKYDGKSNSLESFIIKVDAYFDKYGDTEDDTLNNYVFCLICSKLVDEANDFASCRSDLTTWPALKTALRNKFGDFTDRKILAHQFKTLRLKPNEELNDFIERVKSVQTRLNLKIRMDETISDAQRETYQEIHEQTALEVLYNNAPQMLQTILDVKAHSTLTEATTTVLNYITKHPAEKPKPKSNVSNPQKPQFFRQQPMAFPRPTNYFRPENNRPPISYVNNAQQNNMQRQSFPTNTNSQNNAARNIPSNTNNWQNRNSTANYRSAVNSQNRSNRFQGTVFRNWRQPKPLVNFMETAPASASPPEEPDEFSEYESYETNPDDYPYPENFEYWSLNDTNIDHNDSSVADDFAYAQAQPTADEVEFFRWKASVNKS